MLVVVARFFANDWIAEHYIEPTHFFHYYGLDWVRPWPGDGMYVHFALMGLFALGVALGFHYRASIVAFGLLFSYAHLCDKTNYLNHYYLVMCLCFVMALLPLDRALSVDAWRGRVPRAENVPAWVLYALRAQIGLVYVFGGIAKLSSDWLLHAQPLTIWLAANGDFPVLGALFAHKWMAYAMSWGGAAFDLSIVPLLCWRRSRPLGYVAVVAFHLITARLFHLGMFPWIMMAGSLIFLPPDWPTRVLARIGRPGARGPERATSVFRTSAVVPALLAVYFAFSVAFPLRHFLYPGDTSWTEQGFRFSWNVMLMEKDGTVDYRVVEPSTGRRSIVPPSRYLTRYQARMMATQPDMVLELAHVIRDDFEARGVRNPEVHADAFASLNGRPVARLVDPTVDLASERDGFAPKPWILEETNR